jgi:hypothetical protein
MKKTSPRRGRRYTGKLASPIRISAPPTFSGAVTAERLEKFRREHAKHQRKTAAAVRRQINQKLGALLKHHGIRGDDMGALFWAVVSAHVPGFKIITGGGEKRGRRRHWDGPRLVALYRDVEAAKTPQRRTDRQALKFLLQNDRERWGPPKGHRHNERQWIETLESRLQDAKRYDRFLKSLPEFLPEAERTKNNSGN